MKAHRSVFRTAAATFAIALTLVLTAASCGRENGLVGGQCLEGFVEAQGVCVPTAADEAGPNPPLFGDAADENPSPSLPPGPGTDAGDAPRTVCTAPSVECQGRCLSVENDPFNCGACGRICASRVCIDRACVGESPGSVVLLGHGMSNAAGSSSRAALLRNAIAIPSADPIRILAYDLGTSAQEVLAVRTLIGARVKNRQVVFADATDSSLDSDSLYATYDVVLFSGGLSGDAATLGSRWASPLQTFTSKGGVFLALDPGEADIPALLTAAGLLTVGAHVPLDAATELVVASASNVVGSRVPSPFLAATPAMAFLGVPASGGDLVHVVETSDLAKFPTVIHRIVR